MSAALCAAVSSLTLMLGMRQIKERIAYSPKRVQPLAGFAEVLKNRYALAMIVSEFLKSFRRIASYMGTFLAAALLGDPTKFLLLGLPTGIGTAVGMLAINLLLKRFNSKQLYIASGVYSLLSNACAFGAGYMSFTRGGAAWQAAFIALLFLVGLQYGASNLLPDMFKADICEDLELHTRKRLDASLAFVITIGSFLGGLLVEGLWSQILYGGGRINFIQYKPPVEDVYLEQTLSTKIALLAVYTLGQGCFMLLGSLPFLLYRLTGARKAEIHRRVLLQREAIAAEREIVKTEG